MAWVAGVVGNFLVLSLTQPDIEVMVARELNPSDVLAYPHYYL